MRCDLHVHSWYSGRAGVPVPEHVGRECCSDPLFAAGYLETARQALAGAPDALRVAASLALAPFLPLIPLFTLGVYAHERRFGRRHFRAFPEAFGWPALPWGRRAPIGAASLREAA